MSYQSYAEYEMKLAKTEPHIQKAVIQALTDIDNMGHSGASIEIYLQMVSGWVRKCHQTDDKQACVDLLPEQFHKAVEGLAFDDIIVLLQLVNSLGRFEPLSPLTGEDDEWIDQSGPTGSPLYQNRRCPTVFKDERGNAYHIGTHLHAYPARNYKGWHLVDRGRELSAFEVLRFPYEPTDVPAYTTYYLHDDWEEQLPTAVNPTAWLDWMRERYLKGIDPTTNLVRREAMFLNLDECTDLTKDLRVVLCYLKYNWETVTRNQVIESLGWLADHKEPFEMRWTEPKAEEDGHTEHHVTLTDSRRAAQILRLFVVMSNYDVDYMVGMEDSLIAPMLIDKNHIEYALCFRPVMIPDTRFQFWTHNRMYVPVFSTNLLVEKFYFHDGYKVTGDQEDYLFQKRREHGYTHPRNRRTLDIKLEDDCANPAAESSVILETYRSLDMSKEEGEQIDNVVGKHVKKVFGTDKKD